MASAPAITVRRIPTRRGSIRAAAILEKSGVPPQTAMTARATMTGSDERV
jgi:hypothetical protein